MVYVYKCKWNIETCGAQLSNGPLQNCGRQTGSCRECEGREWGPPASCPGFVYNKKPLFDVAAKPAPKLLLPQDVLRVKCQTEATAGWLWLLHAVTLSNGLWRVRKTYLYFVSVYQSSSGVLGLNTIKRRHKYQLAQRRVVDLWHSRFSYHSETYIYHFDSALQKSQSVSF